jgi:hypothetical protein
MDFSWVLNVLHVPRVNKDLFYTSYIIVVLLKSLTKALSATIAVVSVLFLAVFVLDKISSRHSISLKDSNKAL